MAYYILLKDICMVNEDTYAIGGDILVLGHLDGKKLHLEYPSWSKTKGQVICNPDKVARLATSDALLLMAIGASMRRLKFFKAPGELDEAHNLIEGATVTYEYAKKFTYMEGRILFRGSVSQLGPGTWFGLGITSKRNELTEEDASDGTLAGKRYFDCTPGRGVFTSVDNLKLNVQSRNVPRRAMPGPGASDPRHEGQRPLSSTTRQLPAGAAQELQNTATSSSSNAASKPLLSGGLKVGMSVKVPDKNDDTKKHRGVAIFLHLVPQQGSATRFREMAVVRMEDPYANAVGEKESGAGGGLTVPVELLEYESTKPMKTANGGSNFSAASPPATVTTSITATTTSSVSSNIRRSMSAGTDGASSGSSGDNYGTGNRTATVRPTTTGTSAAPLPVSNGHLAQSLAAGQQQILDHLSGQPTGVMLEQQRRLAMIKKDGRDKPMPQDISPGNSLRSDSTATGSAVASGGSGRNQSRDFQRALPDQHQHDKSCWKTLGLESMVEVPSVDGPKLHGVIKWIGSSLTSFGPQSMAGIELDEEVQNSSDGYHNGTQLFTCAPHRGIFMPLDRCCPDARFISQSPPGGSGDVKHVHAESSAPLPGAAATTRSTSQFPEIERALDKLRQSTVQVPQDIIVHLPDKMQEIGQASKWRALANSLGFNGSDLRALVNPNEDETQSLLSVLWNWVDRKPATFGRLATALCSIQCEEIAYNLLVPALENVSGLSATRIASSASMARTSAATSRRPQPRTIEKSQQVDGKHPPTQEMMEGQNKGIQGHYNSCYMDSTLFAMFAHSMAFDGVLHKAMQQKSSAGKDVQQLLLNNIVNPLRVKGYVSSCHIMELRQRLSNLGKVTGLTDAEKDPEEFLNLMWQTVLKTEPFLKLKAPQRDDSTFIYQLFVEPDGSKKIATVQDLLERSFADSELTLSAVPSVLILQMPRFGREFKPFDKIIPNLQLNITNLLAQGSRLCGLCEEPASVACHKCRKDIQQEDAEIARKNTGGGIAKRKGLLHGDETYVNLCEVCSDQVHRHRRRRDHKPQRIERCERPMRHDLVGARQERMELFAVICIETSHYVSFVKCNASSDDGGEVEDDVSGSEGKWCFFDSMADRVGEQDGYNIPEVKPLPDLIAWVTDPARVAATPAKDITPPEVRRLLCDPYMCLYQNRNMMMYG